MRRGRGLGGMTRRDEDPRVRRSKACEGKDTDSGLKEEEKDQVPGQIKI